MSENKMQLNQKKPAPRQEFIEKLNFDFLSLLNKTYEYENSEFVKMFSHCLISHQFYTQKQHSIQVANFEKACQSLPNFEIDAQMVVIYELIANTSILAIQTKFSLNFVNVINLCQELKNKKWQTNFGKTFMDSIEQIINEFIFVDQNIINKLNNFKKINQQEEQQELQEVKEIANLVDKFVIGQNQNTEFEQLMLQLSKLSQKPKLVSLIPLIKKLAETLNSSYIVKFVAELEKHNLINLQDFKSLMNIINNSINFQQFNQESNTFFNQLKKLFSIVLEQDTLNFTQMQDKFLEFKTNNSKYFDNAQTIVLQKVFYISLTLFANQVLPFQKGRVNCVNLILMVFCLFEQKIMSFQNFQSIIELLRQMFKVNENLEKFLFPKLKNENQSEKLQQIIELILSQIQLCPQKEFHLFNSCKQILSRENLQENDLINKFLLCYQKKYLHNQNLQFIDLILIGCSLEDNKLMLKQQYEEFCLKINLFTQSIPFLLAKMPLKPSKIQEKKNSSQALQQPQQINLQNVNYQQPTMEQMMPLYYQMMQQFQQQQTSPQNTEDPKKIRSAKLKNAFERFQHKQIRSKKLQKAFHKQQQKNIYVPKFDWNDFSHQLPEEVIENIFMQYNSYEVLNTNFLKKLQEAGSNSLEKPIEKVLENKFTQIGHFPLVNLQFFITEIYNQNFLTKYEKEILINQWWQLLAKGLSVLQPGQISTSIVLIDDAIKNLQKLQNESQIAIEKEINYYINKLPCLNDKTQVKIYGSAATGLWAPGCNINYSLILDHYQKENKILISLMKLLNQDKKFTKLRCGDMNIEMPYLLFTHDEGANKYNVKITINNITGIKDIELIQMYSQINEQSQKLLMLIKLWNIRWKNEETDGFNGFIWTLLGIFYLQQRGILPCLSEIAQELGLKKQPLNYFKMNSVKKQSNQLSSEFYSIDKFEQVKTKLQIQPNKNNTNIYELFYGFLKFYLIQLKELEKTALVNIQNSSFQPILNSFEVCPPIYKQIFKIKKDEHTKHANQFKNIIIDSLEKSIEFMEKGQIQYVI